MTSPDSALVVSDTRRCARGLVCPDAVSYVDQVGNRFYLGAAIDDDAALCPTCERHLVWTFAWLMWDVAELTTLLVPSLQVTYRDPDMPAAPRSKKHPPLPMVAQAEALRALIDHETATWANLVADLADIPWSAQTARAQRIGRRVQDATQLLAHRVRWLIGHPEAVYECRSTGDDPTAGHDPDTVTRQGDTWWIRRTGVDAALLFFDLHEQAERLAGRAPSSRLPVPCPDCGRRSLHREHPNCPGRPGRVVCRCCWRHLTDDRYEDVVGLAGLVFGVAG